MSKSVHKESRSMTLWSAASIGVGAMIGAGLFALIGIAVDLAGKLAYVSFLIAGIITLFTTYSVSKLALKYTSKAGPVVYLNEAFGKGIFSGGLNIVMWFGYVIVNSLYARAFGEYSVALLGIEGNGFWIHIFSSFVVILFVSINFLGASLVGKSELIIVFIKLVILLAFGFIGITHIESCNSLVPVNFSFKKILIASGVVFMSYEGFGLVANTAEDIKNPRKNLPRALLLSVLIVIFVYLLVSITVIGNLSINKILEAKEYALAEAAKPFMGQAGFFIMGLAALFSTSSAINATIYGPVHMLQETARARQAPGFFKKAFIQHESGNSLLFTGIIVLLTANLLNLESIAESGSMIFLIIYTMVNIANFKLRKITNSKAWIIIAGTAGTIFAFISLAYFLISDKSASLLFLVLLIAGVYIYQWIVQRVVRK